MHPLPIHTIMQLSTLSLLSVLVGGCSAFVPLQSSSALPRIPLQSSSARPRIPLSSTLVEATETVVDLKPEYAAALEGVKKQLHAMVPEPAQPSMMPLLAHFAQEYMSAHQAAFEAGNKESTDPESAATRFCTGVGYGLKYGMPQSPNHYTFDVSHVALRGTEEDNDTDYYRFGCDFFHNCMDLKSPETNVLGLDNLEKMSKQIAAGENVILLANHQSEADPQVTSSCFELAGYEQLAADMIYVAGHKVTTDPLAIPFSMGRNLICIHSKKHIDADPETKPTKQRQNLKAMNALLKNLKQGGSCIWVAPSGGRDRRDLETGKVPIAPFDSKTIDMFRLMANKSKVTTHFYTLGMVTYDLCPPPDYVESGTGESRNVRFGPVGIAVGKELKNEGGLESRKAFCQSAFAQCQADYAALEESLHQE